TMQRLQVVSPSSRRFKTDIKDLSAKDEDRALSDVAGLKHANFRYKTRRKDGRLSEDPAQPLRTGLIYEEAPESIRDGDEALSTTERLVNVEMALKAAMRRLEELQARHDKLKARRKP
ncbi:MAG: tail fiber domain-containing protein, partial [Elusimicrobiota bacterium]